MLSQPILFVNAQAALPVDLIKNYSWNWLSVSTLRSLQLTPHRASKTSFWSQKFADLTLGDLLSIPTS